ncbi:MAG: CRISPR-associated endonuclease Cas2 [Candidatus Heimdallarchaeaceae archaeon]
MEHLVCYDIVDNEVRKKVGDICQNKGLPRVQYSVFYGDMTKNRAEELELEIKDEIKGEEAIILILELCEKCTKKKKIIVEHKENKEEKKKKEEENKKENKKEKRKKSRIDKKRLEILEKKGVIRL